MNAGRMEDSKEVSVLGTKEMITRTVQWALPTGLAFALMACGGNGEQPEDSLLGPAPTVEPVVQTTATPQVEATIRADAPERIDVPSPTPPPAEPTVAPTVFQTPTTTVEVVGPSPSPVAVATVSVTVREAGAATPAPEPVTTPTAEPTMTPVAEATTGVVATPDPNRELTADEVHGLSLEAMAGVDSHEFLVKLYVDGLIYDGWAGAPVTGYMSLGGRYVAPGTVWVRTIQRSGLRHDVTAGDEIGAMVLLESGGFPGVEAIVGKEEVYVRYLEYENDVQVLDILRSESVAATPVTGWYRLSYADWPVALPDVFTDPSGMLLRVLPKLAAGFPLLGEGEAFFLRAAKELDMRSSRGTLWPPFANYYYPEEELYLPIEEVVSLNQSEPTSVEPVEVASIHVIRRSDHRPVRVIANQGLRKVPGEVIVFFHYPEGGVEPIEIPTEYEAFDRETYEELR